MKGLFALISIAFVLALSGSPLPTTARAGNAPHKDRAVAVFPEPVKLLNVFLKGEYLIVHDDALMAQGKDCTYVYEWKDGGQGDLVISFHCTPAVRAKASHFTFRTAALATNPQIQELREIQFAGSREAHLVPIVPSK